MPTLICPQCKAEFEDEKPGSTVVVCKSCGSRFVRKSQIPVAPAETSDPDTNTPANKQITKAFKCPHCEGLILLKIPCSISFDIKDKEITKKKAMTCQKCKGKKEIDGRPCENCDGVGVVPAKAEKLSKGE